MRPSGIPNRDPQIMKLGLVYKTDNELSPEDQQTLKEDESPINTKIIGKNLLRY